MRVSCNKIKNAVLKYNDNKKKLHIIWGIIKPFLSDKIASKEKLNLIEKNEIDKRDIKSAQNLNKFFSNI